MIRDSHSVTNSLIDGHLDAAINWAKSFEELYQRLEYAIESGNILQARRILDQFAYDYDDVPRAVEHYENMKMGRVS